MTARADVSISEAAGYFDVSTETVRRWIRAGCPCITPGEVGRGHGARLNLADVARWRAVNAGVPVDGDVIEDLAAALVEVATRDGGKGRPIAAEIGMTGEQAFIFSTHVLRRFKLRRGAGE
jgi:phage terminase Nu1 subunit (DNA packaging protein)